MVACAAPARVTRRAAAGTARVPRIAQASSAGTTAAAATAGRAAAGRVVRTSSACCLVAARQPLVAPRRLPRALTLSTVWASTRTLNACSARRTAACLTTATTARRAVGRLELAVARRSEAAEALGVAPRQHACEQRPGTATAPTRGCLRCRTRVTPKPRCQWAACSARVSTTAVRAKLFELGCSR